MAPRVKRALLGMSALLNIGVAAAGIWRGEFEWRDWEGFTWTQQFHWAIPIGVGLFLVWLGFFCDLKPLWKRAQLLVGEAIYAALAYVATAAVGRWYWVFPSPWALIASPARPGYKLWVIWGIYAAVPIPAWLIARLKGVRLTWLAVLVGEIVFLAAYPVGVAMLELTRDVHTYGMPLQVLKSGFVVPLLIIGLGIPFIFTKAPKP